MLLVLKEKGMPSFGCLARMILMTHGELASSRRAPYASPELKWYLLPTSLLLLWVNRVNTGSTVTEQMPVASGPGMSELRSWVGEFPGVCSWGMDGVLRREAVDRLNSPHCGRGR